MSAHATILTMLFERKIISYTMRYLPDLRPGKPFVISFAINRAGDFHPDHIPLIHTYGESFESTCAAAVAEYHHHLELEKAFNASEESATPTP